VSGPISPDPVREWRTEYLPAYVANGLLGLRLGAAPPLGGVALVNSYAGPDPLTEVESQLPIPFPLAGDVTVNGAAMSTVPGEALLREQRYDFSCGQLHTTLSFTAHGVRADIDVLTVCSRAFPAVAMQEMTVRVDADCQLELSGGLDPAGRLGGANLIELGGGGRLRPAHGVLNWHSPKNASSCGIAYLAELAGADGCQPDYRHTARNRMMTIYRLPAQPGRRYRLRQLTSVVPDAIHATPHLHAVRMLAEARGRGFDNLLDDNADLWSQLWQGRVQLTGAPARWQALADAAFFYLQTSVHRASPAATSPFGMAYWPDYHYYRGHVMWDIEAFAVPALLLTQPDAARALLGYRRSQLHSAVHNARSQGYTGAQFPWESGPHTGQEATPVTELPPITEHHVSMDVALAFARYVHATGDDAFARSQAWPVLAEVARWVASRVRHTTRGYEILHVHGIAETDTPVDNNAYVNMSAAMTLREATSLAEALGFVPDPAWVHIADNLVLPRSHTGAVVNHDGYHPDEPQAGTPEAAAGLFPVGYPVDPETERRTLSSIMDKVDDYVGAPMLSALLGVYAARLGRRERALELYERGFADFVLAPYSLTTEYSPTAYPDQPRAAPFTANLGGFLTGCLFGLTGITLGPGQPAAWCHRPVTMPEGWDGIHVDRLWVRGRPATLTAHHGKHASLDLR
jgi:protein-glucosylgalactosylhydroxylysine glucosidase